MKLLDSVSHLYIVEDQLYCQHSKSAVFPDELNDGAIAEMQNIITQSCWACISLKTRLLETVPAQYRDAFEKLIVEGIPNEDLSAWYNTEGKSMIETLWNDDHFSNEYLFLKNNRVQWDSFQDYGQALTYIETSYRPDVGKPALWLLDREIGVNQDAAILGLLQKLAEKGNGIGIIFTARPHGLESRQEIASFVDGLLPTATAVGSPVNLTAISSSVKNLVWCLAKTENSTEDKLRASFLQAEHGFTLFNLLKEYSKARTDADRTALEYVAKLEPADIDHIKAKAIQEGTTISETLIRIHSIFAEDEFKGLLGSQSYYNLLARVEAWEYPRTIEATVFDFLSISSMESFDYHTNEFHTPIRTGDIFAFYKPCSFTKPDLYLLITQECDCVVRAEDSGNLQRGAARATLLKLNKKKDHAQSCSELLLELKISIGVNDMGRISAAYGKIEKVFSQTNKKLSTSDIDKRIYLGPLKIGTDISDYEVLCREVCHAEFKLLDLCCLRRDGRAVVDFTKIADVKKTIQICPKYYQQQLGKVIELVQQNKEKTSTDIPNNISQRDLNKFIINQPTIDYRLQRIAHLTDPRLSLIKAYYAMIHASVGIPVGL